MIPAEPQRLHPVDVLVDKLPSAPLHIQAARAALLVLWLHLREPVVHGERKAAICMWWRQRRPPARRTR